MFAYQLCLLSFSVGNTGPRILFSFSILEVLWHFEKKKKKHVQTDVFCVGLSPLFLPLIMPEPYDS